MESNENYDLQSKSNGQEKMFEELNEEHKSQSVPFQAQKDPLRPNFSASANFASNNDQDFQIKSPDVLMDPDEGDVIDFLFSQESELGLAGVLPNIEDILLNLDEFPFVYPRLAKLFNFIASHLEAYMNQNDPTESQNAVEGLTPYIRLLLDTYDVSRFTQLLFFCVKPPCKLRLSMSPSFLQDFLFMASKNLHEIAGMYPTLLQFLEFAIAPSDVFGLSIPRPYLVVFAHFLQNIYEKPTKELFRFLSQIFFFLPHSLIPRFCEDLLLPTFVILESGLEETAKSLSKEEKQGIMEIIDDWEIEQEEMFVQIAKLLTLIQISPQAKETLFVENTLQRLYNLLRGAHNLGVGNKKLKISLKCTLMIIQTIVCQLQGAEKRVKEEFTQEMYKDIIQSLEKPGSKFLSNVIFPLLSAPALNVVPVCLHLDEEPEALLNSLKSNKNSSMTSSKVFQPAPLNPYTLSSTLLNSQEKNTILSTIQKLCFSNTKKKNSGTATGVHSLQWKRCLQIDFDNAFGGNPLDITQSLTKTDGVLMVFHCLLGQEIAKIGLYCNTKLTQNNLADAYSNQYGGLRAHQSPENFFFYYSDIEKLHFPSSKVPNDTGVNLKASSKAKPHLHSKKSKPSSLSDIDAVFPNDEYLEDIYSMMEEESNIGKKYGKAKSKPKAPQIHQPKIPCVEYSGQRIALYYEGKPILEYFPSAPDTSKVEFRVSNMVSLEESSGKTVLTQSLDSHSVAFVQGVEIWTASFPEEGQNQQDYSQDFMIQELANTTKSAFYDIFKTVRTESPVYLIQKGTTFGDFFTMLFKGNTNLLSKLQIRNVLAGNLALTMKVEELLYVYEKSDFPQILDIFVNTTTSAKVLANELATPEEICGNLLKSQNTEEDLVKYIMTKERAKTLLGKAIASMDKGNNAISKGFKDLLEEMQIFWSMQVYEDMLAEDQEFFGLVLNMLGSTKNKQVLLKLNQRAYTMLEKVFNTKDLAFIIDLDLEKFISTLLKKLKSLDKEADKDGIAVIQGEINMNNKAGKSIGKKPFIFNAMKNKLPVINNLFGAEESKASDDLVLGKEEDMNLNDGIVDQLQNSVITSLMRIMEIELPDEVYAKSFKQIKEEKLMTTILRFLKINSLLGPQNEDNGKLQADILTLLELWSRNDYLSELFWEELEGYEMIGQEQQKIPIYQRFMELIEQSKEKSDSKDFKRGKPKSKKAVAFSTHNLEAIEANLHKIYDINIIEKTTDISNDLALPLAQSYPKCLKHYCVDSANILNHPESRAHHYKNSFSSSSNPSSAKVTRITKELSDLANSLPVSATNAILVRYDQTRMDAMKVLIFGSAETPYGHGAFEYDIFIGDDYPNQPPQVNLMTTGNGTIRFNPNLYACGKVCLSLLGTWRGNGNENWKPNMSTILQVLISIQSIIMTEDVYYNEPGFEGSKGSAEGKRLNEGYSNVVKYANVKFAMVETLKNPPAAFKEPVLIHFYLKKYMIMEELNKWLTEAKHTDGLYTGLVTSHNNNLAHKFQSKDAYYNSLKEAILELEDLLDNLNLRLEKTFKIRTVEWKRKKPRKEARKIEPEAQITFADIKQIDVEYDEKVQHKLIDLKDEKVTNRWSRYIGAMGLEAVEKQANSCVFLIGLNAVGVEIAKNIVLSGVKKFCVCDWKKVEATDFAGQFFLSEKDIGKNRAEASLNKLQALNQYVQLNIMKEKLSSDNLTKQLGKMDSYNVLVCCEGDLNLQICLNEYCRTKGILFISATVKGLFSRVFCDFGDNFQVIDKTGEEQQEFVVREVTPEGVVHLLEGVKHGLQDNDKIVFVQAEEDGEGKSFTETTHSILVKDKNSFSVGDISGYRQLKSGIIKPLKKQETLSFKSFSDTLESPLLDYSISGVDFLAQHKYQLLHVLFLAIEKYIAAAALTESKTNDSIFKRPVEVEVTDPILRDTLEELKRTSPETVEALRDEKEFSGCLTWVNGLVDTYNGVFPPLCAFIGGVVSQEIIKGITRKYTPIKQYFYYECAELYESNRKPSELLHDNNIIDKYEPLKICVGEELFEKLRDTKLFMVGAGAIGCELLKNYAMLGLASNKGKIVLTDPDVIESSNLNRQFLFREKHIRKPKAATAAAVAVQMNPDLHEKVLPMLEKVHEASENIFTEKFFEELDVVTNALDNIQARKYVDSRCVKSRTPLLESGTLGPKGHVQVIIPFKTESYGSQQDPQEDNEIPYCTLKMFPEETLHCIEWARDKFTKMYSQKPSSFVKAMESFSSGKVETLDEKILKEAVKFGKSFPKKFEDCVQWALNKFYKLFVHDIKQLLYTYPLDFKTADGQLFWSLPKRPPHPAPFDLNNASHVAFIASCACLRARVCGIEPPKNARKDKVKKEIAATAAKLKPKAYKISDEKAKELKKQNDKEEKNEKMIIENQEEEKTEKMEFESFGKQEMTVELVTLFKNGKSKTNKYNCNPQEFEKDEDENFHIDFLHAMTNCRAENYGLTNMDWLNVKLKAGRIVPALATTTAAIAGLQTIELCKLLAKCRIEQHKNSFLNFSIPILAQSEPMNAPEFQLSSNLKVNMWDRWEIDLNKKNHIKSIKDLFKELEKTTGLQPLDLLQGNTPVYLYQLMEMPSKSKEKEIILNKNLEDFMQYHGQKHVDVTITFTSEEAKLKNPKDITIKGIPPIRIYYNV